VKPFDVQTTNTPHQKPEKEEETESKKQRERRNRDPSPRELKKSTQTDKQTKLNQQKFIKLGNPTGHQTGQKQRELSRPPSPLQSDTQSFATKKGHKMMIIIIILMIINENNNESINK